MPVCASHYDCQEDAICNEGFCRKCGSSAVALKLTSATSGETYGYCWFNQGDFPFDQAQQQCSSLGLQISQTRSLEERTVLENQLRNYWIDLTCDQDLTSVPPVLCNDPEDFFYPDGATPVDTDQPITVWQSPSYTGPLCTTVLSGGAYSWQSCDFDFTALCEPRSLYELEPSQSPTAFPSATPSNVPSPSPSSTPSKTPTQIPSLRPTSAPSDSPAVAPWENIATEIFDSGDWAGSIFEDGSRFADITTKGPSRVGAYALRIRKRSHATTKIIPIPASVSILKLSFFFYTQNVDYGEQIIVRYQTATSGLASPWVEMKRFEYGSDWTSNKDWMEATSLPLVDVSNANEIRFQVETLFSAKNEKLYVDQIWLDGRP